MKIDFIEAESLAELFLSQTPLIDVRAPIEFIEGSLPGAVNLCILNDEERALVGTLYKKSGPEAATQLGHQLVSGAIKEERIQNWISYLKKHPDAVLFCFRGGQRSQITQRWLQDHGVHRPIIRNGFKFARNFLCEQMSLLISEKDFLSCAGPTGSGKTLLLTEAKSFYPSIDLEGIARHRGSAFGSQDVEQPTQIDFEHEIALAMMQLQKQKAAILIEDESRLIGRSVLPKLFFEKLIHAPVLLIEENIETRVQNIFQDYILNSAIGDFDEERGLLVFQKYQNSLQAISKRLGGARTKEILELMQFSQKDFLTSQNLESNRHWIERLLVDYYDPFYKVGLHKRREQVIFRGRRDECLTFLKNKI